MSALEAIQQETPLVTLEMTNEEVIAIYDRCQFIAREAKARQQQIEAAILEWVQEHGDLIVSDTLRYYAGTEKVTKCINVPAAVEALLVAVGGDFNTMCEALSSNAIKYGAAKKMLPPEVYDQYFTVEYRETLEEGKPKKKLLKADDKFVKKS